MNVDVPNEIAALPPWVAGYEMSPDDVAVLTFDEVDDAMQISSSAVLPLDQLGTDAEEAAELVGSRLSATSAPPLFSSSATAPTATCSPTASRKASAPD